MPLTLERRQHIRQRIAEDSDLPPVGVGQEIHIAVTRKAEEYRQAGVEVEQAFLKAVGDVESSRIENRAEYEATREKRWADVHRARAIERKRYRREMEKLLKASDKLASESCMATDDDIVKKYAKEVRQLCREVRAD